MRYHTVNVSKDTKKKLDLIKVYRDFDTFDELLGYMIKLYEGENK